MGSYGTQTDVWGVGVIIYLLVFGDYPFNGSNRDELFRQIVASTPKYTATLKGTECQWKPSKTCKSFVEVNRVVVLLLVDLLFCRVC